MWLKRHIILLQLRQFLDKLASHIESKLAPDRTRVAYPFRFKVQNLRSARNVFLAYLNWNLYHSVYLKKIQLPIKPFW
ncbi:GTP-binding protein (ISS) [Dorcoceras hygrometricum]|uniref:GTP-binding protein (ISS) n=1 Tax=Dorcoceras hygrometricum TaxID=472368 RepID=A0A2Z6ZY08_9LAMI|nr:GTP-binding protein (ISS) [Dorcoceras hygrometricum]